MTTKSEELFERFCALNRLVFQRIDTADKLCERRPDYRIQGRSGRTVVVEVKQFDPNQDELAAQREREAGRVALFGTTPGDRIRKAISSAGPQLKELAGKRSPALLVVYNNVDTNMHTDPYSVLTAMRGLDVVPVVVPRDRTAEPVFYPSRPGPRKKLTSHDNRTISAIGVLSETSEGAPALDVYHNQFARVPLATEELNGDAVTHFRMLDDQSGWETMSSNV